MFSLNQGNLKLKSFTYTMALIPLVFCFSHTLALADPIVNPVINAQTRSSTCSVLKQQVEIIAEDILDRIGQARIASRQTRQERELNNLMGSLRASQILILRNGLQNMANRELDIARHLISPVTNEASFNEQLARLQINLQEERLTALRRLPRQFSQIRTFNERMRSFFNPNCRNCFTDQNPTNSRNRNNNESTFHGYEETTINPATRIIERCYSYHFTDQQFPNLQGLRLCSSRSMNSAQAPASQSLFALQGNQQEMTSIQLSPASRGRALIDNFENLTPIRLQDLLITPECRNSPGNTTVNASRQNDRAHAEPRATGHPINTPSPSSIVPLQRSATPAD